MRHQLPLLYSKYPLSCSVWTPQTLAQIQSQKVFGAARLNRISVQIAILWDDFPPPFSTNQHQHGARQRLQQYDSTFPKRVS